jgi:uncharacterized protein
MTNNCNLGCKYCYTGSAFFNLSKIDQVNKRFVELLPVLYRFFDQLMEYNENQNTKVTFHGGEPLLITVANWRKMLDYIKFKNFYITPTIQTNGTLINDDYLKLFKEYNFEIGVSLDGTKELNDITRPLKNGKSSFPLVYKGILQLKEHSLKFGVLVTLNKTNLNEIETLYGFFKERNIPFSIRPIFQTQYIKDDIFQLSPKEYGKAFCKLFDIWFDDENANISLINEFTSLIAQFVNPIEGLVSCNFTMKCSEHFIAFDLNGEVSPCNRFYGAKEFIYGNILDQTLEELLNSPVAKPLSKRWGMLANGECCSCEIQEYCFGGCPADSFSLKGDYFAKDYYCESYKMIFHHVNNRIQAVLKKYNIEEQI